MNDWETGPVHGDDDTGKQFVKDSKVMTRKELSYEEATEFLFMEGI